MIDSKRTVLLRQQRDHWAEECARLVQDIEFTKLGLGLADPTSLQEAAARLKAVTEAYDREIEELQNVGAS